MSLRTVAAISVLAAMSGCANCGRDGEVVCGDPIASLFCEDDGDCACGRSTTTGECAYGARECIDATEQCSDFCTGIEGHLTIECHEGICQQVTVER